MVWFPLSRHPSVYRHGHINRKINVYMHICCVCITYIYYICVCARAALCGLRIQGAYGPGFLSLPFFASVVCILPFLLFLFLCLFLFLFVFPFSFVVPTRPDGRPCRLACVMLSGVRRGQEEQGQQSKPYEISKTQNRETCGQILQISQPRF